MTNRNLVATATCAAALLVTACASGTSPEIASRELAVRDLIEVRELESVPSIRSDDSRGWTSVTPTFLVYRTRRAQYLFEFARPCWELEDRTRIVADERHRPNEIRARFETLRGCRIAAIYSLTEAEAVELEHIGASPVAD